MMPYIQGDRYSVPDFCDSYRDIIESLFLQKGDIGFLTIDESFVTRGKSHRGQGSKYSRALHTEAGKEGNVYKWGLKWGDDINVKLDRSVKILLANNLHNSCAIWNEECENTSLDGDIGHIANDYPYDKAIFLKADEVCEIGILTPHESIPVQQDFNRQFLRIISSGVYGREEHFTRNPILSFVS